MIEDSFTPDTTSADIMHDDEAYLRCLRAEAPGRSPEVIARMDRVNSVYVVTYRDKALSEAFDTYIEDLLATRDGRRREADVFFVTGESGAGKSQAVTRLLNNHPVLKPRDGSFGTIRPHVSVKLSGYMLPGIAAKQVMEAAGHRVGGAKRRGDLWHEMPAVLRKRRVILAASDEIQHLVGGSGTANDYAKLADAIKGVSIADPWPVGFVLSGLPRIKKLAVNDEQFARRSRWAHFGDMNMDKHRRLVVRVLEKFTEAGSLELGPMPDSDMPQRIAHASNFRFGRICQLVGAAVHQAIRDEEAPTKLLRGHFALAYANRSRARDNNLMNPFLVDDWEALPPGSYLTDEPSSEKEDEE